MSLRTPDNIDMGVVLEKAVAKAVQDEMKRCLQCVKDEPVNSKATSVTVSIAKRRIRKRIEKGAGK